MLAYNQNDSVVNKKTVIVAAERALGSDITVKSGKDRYSTILMSTTAMSFTAFVALASFWWGQTQTSTIQEQISTNQLAVVSKVLPEPEEDNKPNVKLVRESTNLSKVDSVDNSQTKITENLPAIARDNKEIVVLDSKIILENTPEIRITEVIKADNQMLISANKIPQKNNIQQNYKVTEVEGVSDDLLARFQAAIEETQVDSDLDWQQSDSQLASSHTSSASSQLTDNSEQNPIPSLTQMSQQFQNTIPSLSFEQHIYTSDGQSWINVNGRDRYEGDYIEGNIIVEKILPQEVILSSQGEKFSLPALTNW
jgi:hypothetical protein